jgi:hypothetical protein
MLRLQAFLLWRIASFSLKKRKEIGSDGGRATKIQERNAPSVPFIVPLLNLIAAVVPARTRHKGS